ncbi:MAG: twin-arginine translocase TatA/TatE family subunit [Gammaproteobacteria bacterium]|nr:twin-arginine translocase TatA/TatE family subunit [Gammaproteobacteria bacterium]
MGIGGIGIWQLLIILVIVLLLFGTKKLKNIGGDLGGAIRSFKKAVSDDKGGVKKVGDDAAKTADGDSAAAPDEVRREKSG